MSSSGLQLAAELLVGEAITFLDRNGHDPDVLFALDALVRLPMAGELAARINKGEIEEAELHDMAKFVPSGTAPRLCEQKVCRELARAIVEGRVIGLLLSVWKGSPLFRRIASGLVTSPGITETTLRNMMVHYLGYKLPVLSYLDEARHALLPRLVSLALYNFGMNNIDKWHPGLAQKLPALEALPFFNSAGWGELAGALVFPATGSGNLNWFIRSASHVAVPAPQIDVDPAEPLKSVPAADVRHEQSERGWHAVVWPGGFRDPAASARLQLLCGKSAQEQEEFLRELFVGWRVATTMEVMVACYLHARLFGAMPIENALVRCAPNPQDASRGSSTWALELPKGAKDLKLRRLAILDAPRNVCVFLARMPNS